MHINAKVVSDRSLLRYFVIKLLLSLFWWSDLKLAEITCFIFKPTISRNCFT